MLDQKKEILEMLSLKKYKWSELKDKKQDVTQENFISNVIWTLDWIIGDIEKM